MEHRKPSSPDWWYRDSAKVLRDIQSLRDDLSEALATLREDDHIGVIALRELCEKSILEVTDNAPRTINVPAKFTKKA